MAEDLNVRVVPTPVNPVEIKGAIAFSAEHSRVWAEGTDSEVEKLGGEHSSKGWSTLAEGEAKAYTDQQLAQARSEITTQINNATNNAVTVANAYTDAQKQPATLSTIGLVKPDGSTTSVDADGTIHAVSSSVPWGNITGNIADQSDLQTALSGKQDTLTAGSNITIFDNTISATDTTYTAGSNIQINSNVISATDTTYSAFTGADGTAAGTAGLVPAPAAADNVKYLKGDGTWATVESLPSQTGNNGKFLTTNGSVASWATVSSGVDLTSNQYIQGKKVFTDLNLGTDSSLKVTDGLSSTQYQIIYLNQSTSKLIVGHKNSDASVVLSGSANSKVSINGTEYDIIHTGNISSYVPSAPTLTWYTGNTGTTVTIASTASANLVKIYKNGILLEPTADYSISGTTLTLVTALVSTDKITLEVF